ncbi:MAG: LuxR C-terminal-related transcriptional regulator [Chloroflexota bacterium]
MAPLNSAAPGAAERSLGRHKLRLAIVEDDDLYRDMLKIALARHPAVEVVGTFTDAESALAAMVKLAPDGVLVDVDLGRGMDGVSMGLALRRKLPRIAVVLLTNQILPHILSLLPEGSAAGWAYLHKRSVRDTDALARALEGAVHQLVVVDDQLVEARTPRPDGPIDRLSPRQRQVLELIVQGYSNAAIAEKLVIAPKSVEHHINQLYRELGIQTGGPGAIHPRVQAVLVYLKGSAARPG